MTGAPATPASARGGRRRDGARPGARGPRGRRGPARRDGPGGLGRAAGGRRSSGPACSTWSAPAVRGDRAAVAAVAARCWCSSPGVAEILGGLGPAGAGRAGVGRVGTGGAAGGRLPGEPLHGPRVRALPAARAALGAAGCGSRSNSSSSPGCSGPADRDPTRPRCRPLLLAGCRRRARPGRRRRRARSPARRRRPVGPGGGARSIRRRCRSGRRATLDVAHPDTLTTLVLGLDDALEVVTVRVDGQAVLFWRDGDGLSVPLAGGATRRPSRSSTAASRRPGSTPTRAPASASSTPTAGPTGRRAGSRPSTTRLTRRRLDLTARRARGRRGRRERACQGDSLAGGQRHARFVLDDDAPPYTWAFAVADFTVTEQDGPVPVRHALLAGDAGLAGRLGRTPAALEALAEMLGPYPYDGYATVQVPMEYAGMENAAAPFLRAELYAADADGPQSHRGGQRPRARPPVVGQRRRPGRLARPVAERGRRHLPHRPRSTSASTAWDAGRRFRTLMSREIGPEDAAPPARPDGLRRPRRRAHADGLPEGRLRLPPAPPDPGRRRLLRRPPHDPDRVRRPPALDRRLPRRPGGRVRPDLDRVFAYWVDGRGRPDAPARAGTRHPDAELVHRGRRGHARRRPVRALHPPGRPSPGSCPPPTACSRPPATAAPRWSRRASC